MRGTRGTWLLVGALGACAPQDPVGVHLFPSAPRSTDDLEVRGTTASPEAWAWWRDGERVRGLDGPRVPAALTARGEVWSVRAVVRAAPERLGPAEASVAVAGDVPTLSAVRVTPGVAFPRDTLTCGVVASDADRDDVGLAIRWTRDGALVGSGPTLRVGEGWQGSTVVCEAQGVDVDGASAWVASPARTVGNRPPAVFVGGFDPQVPRSVDVVGLRDVSWADPDGDPVTLDHRWLQDRDGAFEVVATGPELPAGRVPRGRRVFAEVTATDALGAATTMRVGPAVLANAKPRVRLNIEPSVPTRADGVRVSVDATDDDGDPLTVDWTWFGARPDPADPSRVPPGVLVRGETLRVLVRVGDPYETTVVEATGPVGNSAPRGGRVDVHALDEGWSCAPQEAEDADGDPVSWRVAWFVDGAAGPAEAFLPSEAAAGAATVRCEATPSDGLVDGARLSSPVVPVSGRPPTLDGLRLEPAAPTARDTVDVVLLGARDPDGDPVRVDLVWQADGEVVHEGATLPPRRVRRGQVLRVEATPHDGALRGPTVAEAVAVGNSAPQIVDLDLSSTRAGPRLVATAVVDDPDGDDVDVDFSWVIDGVAAGVGPVLEPPGGLIAGQVVVLEAVPHDGTDAGAALRTTVEIADGQPVVDVGVRVVSWAPHTPPACEVEAVDPEGQPLTIRRTWRVDGVAVGAGPTLDPGLVGPGATVACEAEVDDGVSPPVVGRDEVVLDSPGGNLLVVVMDDVGTDKVGVYGESPTPPPTPNLDALADEGLLFRRAYAQPTCSPTRASLLTGQHPRRHGVGRWIAPRRDRHRIPDAAVTLPEVLSASPTYRYTSALVGKWHTTPFADVDPGLDPLRFGFSTHRGSLGNPRESTQDTDGSRGFYYWEKNVDGVLTMTETYMTVDTVAEAQALVLELPQPWFLMVSFNASHSPWAPPPPELTSLSPQVGDPPSLLYAAMTDAMDRGIASILETLSPEVRADTTIVVMSDNGTPSDVILPPHDDTRGKGKVYEGGVRVPMIVAGPLVNDPGAESEALVHVVDLLPTAADLAGVDLAGLREVGPDGLERPLAVDGVSLLPVFADATAATPRRWVYAERFYPHGGPPLDGFERTVVGDRFKLALFMDGTAGFYDLLADPVDEGESLLSGTAPLDPDAQRALHEAWEEMDRLDRTLRFRW